MNNLRNRKLIAYFALSLDGYIAAPNDNLDFLKIVEKPGQDYGYFKIANSVDTLIMGRKTFNWLIKNTESWPHNNKKCFVISSQKLPNTNEVTFYNGKLKTLVETLKAEQGAHILCEGGAQIMRQMLELNLIDEMTISFIPCVLGAGTPFFIPKFALPEHKISHSQCFDTGLYQITFTFNTSTN